MQQTWSYTKTLLARLDVVGTFKGSGFTTTSNHIISNMCLSNGKNSSQLSLQPSPGARFGGKSVSDSTVTTSWLSTRGKANFPNFLVSCPWCACFVSQNIYLIPQTFDWENKLNSGCFIQKEIYSFLSSRTTGTVTANTNPWDSNRALNAQL